MAKGKWCFWCVGFLFLGTLNVNYAQEADFMLDEQIAKQREALLLLSQEVSASQELEVFDAYQKAGSLPIEDQSIGKKEIAQGKVGCLIVAGGQGSRLNYTKPKGLYPVTCIKQKSLFQLYAEKIRAAGKEGGRPLFVAVMTSPGNQEETLKSFEEHHFFGLQKDQVFFYSQDELPFLDAQGNPFLEAMGRLARGPDGNASSLKCFFTSGVWDLWKKAGIEYVNYMHIDNALADPFDAVLSGFHVRHPSSDVIVKCIARDNPLEKLGVLFQVNGKVSVIEYSEISPRERDAKGTTGERLKHLCANIGLYSFKMDFIRNIARSYYDQLPFHLAWKAASYLDTDGMTKMSTQPMAWKFEKFIFDVLPYARDVKALLYPRTECFAPLKNATGEDSIISVQQALQKRDREVFEQITGKALPSSAHCFELDPAFYYPSQELLAKWRGRDLPQEAYLEP